MHEQSETQEIQHGNGWENVIGRNVRTPGAQQPGTRLRPLFPFEKDVYASESDAIASASQRSELFGRLVELMMSRHNDIRGMADINSFMDAISPFFKRPESIKNYRLIP